MQIIRSGVIVAFFTLISRIFGYIRDIFMAYYLGLHADSFAVAFRLPNTFRALFGEGALSSAFVPVFSSKIATTSEEEAFYFASKVFSLLFVVLLLFVGIMLIFMPSIIKILAPGFISNESKLLLTINLAYFTTPYLFFISLCSLYSGILNSTGRFAIAAGLPIILNVTMIFAIKLLTPYSPTPSHALAFGVFIAGIIQFVVISFAAYHFSIKIKFTKFTIDNDIKLMFKNMIPAIIGSGVIQINMAIDTVIASFIEEAASIIYFADRLNQFPLAIIGTALGTVLLPTLSRQIRENNPTSAQTTQNKALEFALFLTLPCAFALIIIGDTIISILFERGNFSYEDSKKVASALAALALGLPAFVMIKIFTPRFLAEYDTKTPVRISALCIIINIISSIILIQFFSFVGIALATSLSGWINIIQLAFIQHKRKLFQIKKSIVFYATKLLISCLAMSLILLLFENNKQHYCQNFSSLITLICEIILGMITYFVCCYFLKIISFNTNLKGVMKL